MKKLLLSNLKRTLFLFFVTMLSLQGWAAPQGYAYFDYQSSLIFKYGEKPSGKYVYSTDYNGVQWHADRFVTSHIKRVIFDASYANARPTSTYYWFGSLPIVEIVGIEYLNTSQVTNMAGMFSQCRNLTSLDVSHFDTSNVTNMSNMFSGCSGLTSLDLGHFDTSNVTDVSFMFYGCSSMTSLDLSHFVTDNVTNMANLFANCTGLTTLDVTHFSTSNVTNMGGLFSGCSGLTSLDLSHFDTSNVTNMGRLFSGCNFAVDLDQLNTDKVTNMSGMFSGYTGLTSLDLSQLNTHNVTDMSCMFSGCNLMIDLGQLNTDKVTNMSGMFSGSKGLTTRNLSRLNTHNVTDMSYMFDDCNQYTALDLSNFDTSNVTDMSGMFRGCRILRTIDLRNFDTSKCKKMDYMFSSCKMLSNLDISSFNTSNVLSMKSMFQECNLDTLDIRNFNTSNVGDMSYIFHRSYIPCIILGPDFNTINTRNNCYFGADHHIWSVTFTGNLPRLSEYTFVGVGLDIHGTTLYVPNQYLANYAAKIDVTGKFYGGYFRLVGYTPATPPVTETFTIGNLSYTKLDETNVSVSAADTGISGDVQIPSMVRDGSTMYAVTAIGERGFAGCADMTGIRIPASITAIGDYGFADCTGLTEVAVSIVEPLGISTSVFEGVDKQHCVLSVPDGCGGRYRNAPVWEEFWHVTANDEMTDDGITYAINSDGTLTVVSANHSAEGRYEIPSTVVIGGVEYTVTAIGANAFSGCTDMTALTIPETIVTIGSRAFAGCTNLMEIYCMGSTPIDLTSAFVRPRLLRRAGAASQFDGVDTENCVLYVPFGTADLYRSAEGWKEFKHIVEMKPSGIEAVKADEAAGADGGSAPVYRANGQRLPKPRKGLNIIGGKKVMVK